jgi:hypothetical protein
MTRPTNWFCHEPRRSAKGLPCAALMLAAIGIFVPGLDKQSDADEPRALDGGAQNEGQIEDAYAAQVEIWNDLLRKRRYDEALMVAQLAQRLQPTNPASELMVLKSKFAHHLVGFEAVGDDPIRRQMHARVAEDALDQLVFREPRAVVRTLLDTQLANRIASIDQVCRLTTVQKQRLDLAGRGDIKHFFDHLGSLQRELLEGSAADQDQLCEWAVRVRDNAATIRKTLRSSMFKTASLFSKALKTTLTAEQAAEYAAMPPTLPEDSLIRWVNSATKVVWISVGEADDVQPRTNYRVLKKPLAKRDPGEPQPDHPGERFKGTIEVTRVIELNLSEARILDEDAGNPIAKGDRIAP